MAMVKFIGIIVLAASMLVGCGKKSDPTPAAGKPTTSSAPPSPATSNAASASATTKDTAAATPGTQVPAAKPAPAVAPKAEKPPLDPSFVLELAKIEAMEQEAQFTEAIRFCISLQATRRAPNEQESLGAVMTRLLEEKEEAPNLRQAIKYLSSGSQNYIQVARTKLLAAGELGRIFLRKAMREEKDAAALLAAQLLVEQTDVRSFPVFAHQMLTREPGALAELMANSMRIRINSVDTNILAAFHNAILADTNLVRREAASVLVTAYDTRCKGSVDAYNQLVGAPDGFTALRDYVERSFLSTNPQVVTWACQQGGSLIGSFNTAIARYYADTEFGNLSYERPETQIALADYDKPPFPGGTANNFSARWTGLLEIPKAGKYTFHASADDGGSLSVDTQVLTGVFSSGTNMTIELQPGRVPISAELVQRQHGYNIRVEMQGPDMPRRVVDSEVLRCPPWSDAALALRPAIRDLASTNRTDVRAAKARLAWAFTAGDIYLRDALQNEPAPVAARAAEWLATRRDPHSAALLIARIEKEPTSPYIRELSGILRTMAPILTPDQIQHLYKAVLQDTQATMLPHASALCALLNDVHAGDTPRFNAAVGNPDAYDQLQRYVQRATESSNDTVVATACEFGAPFVAPAQGLRGRYYLDPQWDELAAERTDACIQFKPQQYPVATNSLRNLSARWSGNLEIGKPGNYVLWIERASAQVDFWINDKPLAFQQVPGGQHRYTNAMTLAKGTYRIRIDARLTGDWNGLSLLWSGPGIDKQVIPSSALRTPLHPAEIAKLATTINSLGSTNKVQLETAKATILQAGGAGKVYLKKAASGQGPVAEAAAKLLTP